MAQLRAYCSEFEIEMYNELDRDTKEAINKRTRLFWAGLVKKARGDSK
jgi:hypothetical protein